MDPPFSKHMWRHTLCLSITNTAKIMHLGQSSACNQDYENLVFLIFLNKWSMYRWLEMYSDMVLLCSCFLTRQFFPPCKSDWFQILSVALVAKKSAKLSLLISKLCSSSFRHKILMPRHCNCKFSAHFNDLLFWFLLLTTWNYKGKGLWGPWEDKIQIDAKGEKATGKSFDLVYTFSKISLSWNSQSSEWVRFLQPRWSKPSLPTAPLRHSPETQHIQGEILKPGYSEKADKWKEAHRFHGSVHVWWEKIVRGIGESVLFQKCFFKETDIPVSLWGRHCVGGSVGPPTMPWLRSLSLTGASLKMHSPDKMQRHKE